MIAIDASGRPKLSRRSSAVSDMHFFENPRSSQYATEIALTFFEPYITKKQIMSVITNGICGGFSRDN
jgi:hypothetical protein